MIYFAHPYSSWERPRNERHNGMLRDYIPKGKSIEEYTDEEILSYADELNSRPRRVLSYHTPKDLFETFLDKIYACWELLWIKNSFNLLLQFTRKRYR